MREIFSNSIDYKSGQGGSVYITSTGTGAFQGFVACEDSVIGSITDQNGLQIVNALGLSGNTIKQGIYIGAPKGMIFTKITVNSGSIVGYSTLTSSKTKDIEAEIISAYLIDVASEGAYYEGIECLTNTLTS